MAFIGDEIGYARNDNGEPTWLVRVLRATGFDLDCPSARYLWHETPPGRQEEITRGRALLVWPTRIVGVEVVPERAGPRALSARVNAAELTYERLRTVESRLRAWIREDKDGSDSLSFTLRFDVELGPLGLEVILPATDSDYADRAKAEAAASNIVKRISEFKGKGNREPEYAKSSLEL